MDTTPLRVTPDFRRLWACQAMSFGPSPLMWLPTSVGPTALVKLTRLAVRLALPHLTDRDLAAAQDALDTVARLS